MPNRSRARPRRHRGVGRADATPSAARAPRRRPRKRRAISRRRWTRVRREARRPWPACARAPHRRSHRPAEARHRSTRCTRPRHRGAAGPGHRQGQEAQRSEKRELGRQRKTRELSEQRIAFLHADHRSRHDACAGLHRRRHQRSGLEARKAVTTIVSLRARRQALGEREHHRAAFEQGPRVVLGGREHADAPQRIADPRQLRHIVVPQHGGRPRTDAAVAKEGPQHQGLDRDGPRAAVHQHQHAALVGQGRSALLLHAEPAPRDRPQRFAQRFGKRDIEAELVDRRPGRPRREDALATGHGGSGACETRRRSQASRARSRANSATGPDADAGRPSSFSTRRSRSPRRARKMSEIPPLDAGSGFAAERPEAVAFAPWADTGRIMGFPSGSCNEPLCVDGVGQPARASVWPRASCS